MQAIYRGWALLGIVLIAALCMNLLAAIMVRAQPAATWSAAAATALLALSLAIFFMWTFPVNEATNNWSVAPENWRILRALWEYSHAVNAGVTFLALCASTLSGLAFRR